MIEEKIKDILNVENDKPGPKSIIEQYIDWLFDQYDYRFNEITQRPEYSEKDQYEWKPVDDIFVNSLEIKARIDGFSKSIASLANTILKSVYIPHQNDLEIYLKSLPKPEGVIVSENRIITPKIRAYFDMLKIRSFEKHDRDTLFKYFQKWMIAAVNNALKRKHNDVMLVLMGDQGKMKTSYLEHLVPKQLKEKYYYVGHIEASLTNNNTANYLCEKFIINIDDQLDQIFNRDFNSLKSIISVSQVTNRRVYSVYDKTRKRIANFVGSVNNTNFLIDSENRRYFVLNVEEINPDYLKINANDLWAEAYYVSKQLDPYKIFTREDYMMINDIANQYVVQSQEQLLINRFFRPQRMDRFTYYVYMQTSEISYELSKYSKDKLSTRKISLELKRMGFEFSSVRLKRYGYEPRLVHKLYVKDNYFSEFSEYEEKDDVLTFFQ